MPVGEGQGPAAGTRTGGNNIILDLSPHLPTPTHPGGESLSSRLPEGSGEGVVLRAVVSLVGRPEQVHLWREIWMRRGEEGGQVGSVGGDGVPCAMRWNQ